MTSTEFREFLGELEHYCIECQVHEWHIELTGGDKRARAHYQKVLYDNPEIEALLILEAAKHDDYLNELIEERAAIRQADNLPGDRLSAVMCNMKI